MKEFRREYEGSFQGVLEKEKFEDVDLEMMVMALDSPLRRTKKKDYYVMAV